MASDESLTMGSSSILDDDYEDTDDGFNQTRQSSLSRLSICTSSLYDEAAAASSEVGIVMSGLSLESLDGAEADGEVSDEEDKGGGKEEGGSKERMMSSDSDKERGFYSLPATASRRRRKLEEGGGSEVGREKERKIGRERRGTRERKASWGWMVNKEREKEERKRVVEGEGLMVITKAKGGKRSMRMGMEEVKGCRDLGFQLELVVPGRVSGSTLETHTSCGANSPIANWRISSPGDDPREVKARLKVWAQAVALASASRHAS